MALWRRQRRYEGGMYVTKYHKIQTLFKRDPATKMKTLIMGEYTTPEFEYLRDCQWVFTEKVDGTNVRVVCQDGTFEFKGRTDNAQMPAPLMERLRERFLPQAHRFAEKFPDGVCLYGEGYGAKIQSGGKYRPDQDFVLFDVKVGEWWLERQSVEDIADEFGLDVVPIIGYGTLGDMVKMVQQGFKSQWGAFIAEGIVARPEVELKTRSGERIITKLKHRDFNEWR